MTRATLLVGDHIDSRRRRSSHLVWSSYTTALRYMVCHIPAVTAPGTTNDYNNVNYQALGFVLEAATGQSYATYLSQKLWQPLATL
ncbi:MAG TPA: serine hydrolase [Candidatus Binatia bacterium]|nr:serine hydrolase [Candidatus Binatia bacterium]